MNLNNPKTFPLIGAVFAAIFWVADAILDAWFFEDQQSFHDSFFHPDNIELWMRSLVIVLFIIFSMYAKNRTTKLIEATKELTRHRNDLEELVALRTAELEKTNKELNHEIQERKNAENELKKLASTDPLTLLFNRRKFQEVLELEINIDRRLRTGLFLIICDIDHFKQLNDKHGHDAGDSVLREFSALLKSILRETDTVARLGGEEFIILIPNTTDKVAVSIAEKLRNGIASHDFKTAGKITASFGITNFLAEDNAETATKRADIALYTAKENGRNRVELMLG